MAVKGILGSVVLFSRGGEEDVTPFFFVAKYWCFLLCVGGEGMGAKREVTSLLSSYKYQLPRLLYHLLPDPESCKKVQGEGGKRGLLTQVKSWLVKPG